MRRFSWLLPALVVTTGLLVASPAAARTLDIERFDAAIRVLPDGTIDVKETIQVQFNGAWRGLYRTIPVEYRTPQGLNYTLLLEVQQVTDGGGNPLKWDSSRLRAYRKLKVYVPGAEDAHKTIVISYRVLNALRFFEEHDELYWNITGDEWDWPIQAASAQIELPATATGLRATVFTGPCGSTAHGGAIGLGATAASFQTRAPLGFHEGMTVAVAWDKGAVREPSLLAKAALILRSNWPFALPLGALALMALLWYTRGRDPRLRPIAPRYKPPEGLTPAEVGTLADDSADMADITATIVDLAVRGFLSIQDTGGSYSFWTLKVPAEWTALKPHEQAILNGLFSTGTVDSVSMSDLENRFYVNLEGIRDGIYTSLLGRDYYRSRPDRVRARAYRAAFVLGIGIVILGAMGAGDLGTTPASFMIAGIATAVIVGVFGHFMPARTVGGTRALEEVLGFQDFLDHVDADRFERTIKTPELFEAYLPYAMALRVDRRWAAAFAAICTQPPQWYSGSNFDSSTFGDRLHSMSSDLGTTLGSSPRSDSSSSGFGGGGGSGGGGGGGGGGGF